MGINFREFWRFWLNLQKFWPKKDHCVSFKVEKTSMNKIFWQSKNSISRVAYSVFPKMSSFLQNPASARFLPLRHSNLMCNFRKTIWAVLEETWLLTDILTNWLTEVISWDPVSPEGGGAPPLPPPSPAPHLKVENVRSCLYLGAAFDPFDHEPYLIVCDKSCVLYT